MRLLKSIIFTILLQLLLSFNALASTSSHSTHSTLSASAIKSHDNSYDGSVDNSFDRAAIVAIKIKGARDFCSGVVVAPNEILTATHCVYNLNKQHYFPASEIQVGIGKNVLADDFYWLPIENIKTAPAKSIETVNDFIGNDIVRLTTAKPLPVTPLVIAKFIAKPIATPIEHKSQFLAWGFGEDSWGYYGIKKSRPLEGVAIEENFITFSAGACRGDSGGPILDEHNQVVGIISMSEIRHCVNKGKRMAQRLSQGH